MEDLFADNGRVDLWLDTAIAMIVAYTPKVILAIITLLVGLWLIRRVVNVMDRKLHARDPSLSKFLCGLVSIILKILLLISVASMIGIATTSFVAIIGAAGLAIGLALQGSLANFAGGVLILIFKPFKVGDTIEAQGFLGSVIEINILYTIINTFDNRRIVVPNGSLSNASLVNVSYYDTRRGDISFPIRYEDDVDKAKAIIRECLEEDERVLKDPAPVVVVGSLGEYALNITVRPWTKSGDLWPVTWDLQEKVLKALDAAGFETPYPQRSVHLYDHKDGKQELIHNTIQSE